MSYLPCNPNATPEAGRVLQYLADLRGNGIILGQHTQTMEQAELGYIMEVTGKEPALCGFELLGYSPNIDYENSSPECLKEVRENQNTLEKAFEWAERKGLITFTFHWFSPLGGSDKAFYQRNTPFDARLALVEGTPERAAFLSDIDVMAGYLKPFYDKKIPILWRPFHEADGDWFWWGSRGPETAKGLYLTMKDIFIDKYALDNLIWVWNSPLAEGYVGDGGCDVISLDTYLPRHEHSDYSAFYEKLTKITPAGKITALGETGPIPGIERLAEKRIPWTWFMTWSNSICREEVTGRDVLNAAYHHEYAVTLDKLPELY
jgi:mannan endo-1,4-beta-mannosidase